MSEESEIVRAGASPVSRETGAAPDVSRETPTGPDSSLSTPQSSDEETTQAVIAPTDTAPAETVSSEVTATWTDDPGSHHLLDNGSADVRNAGAGIDTAPCPATHDSASADPVSRETDFETPIAREAAQAVHVLNVRRTEWPRPVHTRVLTVANQKGGVGKTTSAVNIAAALALHGLRVLLIDLDPQGNASTALGIEHSVGTPSTYDVLLGGRPIEEVAQATDFAPSLSCVPATLDLAGADIELTSQVAREYRLQRALRSYLDGNPDTVDYVLIDCPPSLGLLTLNALVAAREVLLPIQCEYYALEGLAQLLKTVDLVTSHLNPQLIVTTVLLTMYDSRTRLADQVADEVRRHFGAFVLEPVIPRNVRVSEAPGFGQTVMTYDAGSRGAIGYLNAAHEIALRGTQEIVGYAAASSDGGRQSEKQRSE